MIAERHEEILSLFRELDNWEDRYKKIISLGKELKPLPEKDKVDENLVKGCQSQVWVTASLEGDKITYTGDSDALIVRGLVALLIKLYSGSTPDEVLGTNPDFIGEIGFEQQLSPSRAKGLGAMIKQIKYYALAFKALSERNNA